MNHKLPLFARKQKRYLEKKRELAGTDPGHLVITSEATPTTLHLTCYSLDKIEEVELKMPADANQYINKGYSVCWLDVRGLANATLLTEVAKQFQLHPLALADAVNLSQRSKFEEYDNNLFFITEIMRGGNTFKRDSSQLSVFFDQKLVITIHEGESKFLNSLLERLRIGRGPVRENGPDYLAALLLDYAIDTYYPLLDDLGREIEMLEHELFHHGKNNLIERIYEKKRDFLFLRRNIWNEREAAGELLRCHTGFVSPHTRTALRDIYDHIIQICDIVVMNLELVNGLINYHQSELSRKLNESIKVLTIISTIFIPLTFLVGIYGMNFSATPMPKDATNFLNMPELYSPYGYVGFWVISALLTISMLFFFWSKGWIGKHLEKKEDKVIH